MNTNFDAYTYFTEIAKKLKASKNNGFHPCKVSGLANMEEVIAGFKGKKAYFAIDDTNDGITCKGNGGGYFDRKQYIVYLLYKVPQNNMDAQGAGLNICRKIFHSICTKLIKDKQRLSEQMTYLDTTRIPFYELEGYSIAGCTGLYFMITVDQPINLCYNADEWDE